MDVGQVVAAVAGGGPGLGEATAGEIVARGGRVAIFDLGRSKGEVIRLDGAIRVQPK